jgi:UTP--glucose-1-phosphate uridylyltransferase
MARLLRTQPIYGYRYEGTRFDCGNKAGFQMANLAFAMERPEIRARLLPFINSLIDAPQQT